MEKNANKIYSVILVPKFAIFGFSVILDDVFYMMTLWMVNYQGAVEEYKKLDYAQKKVRLMTLFEIFQAHSKSIQEMLPLLKNDQIREEEMIQAYKNLTSAMEIVEKKNISKLSSQMDQLHAKIEEIRRREAEEAKNDNPEDLLKRL